MLSRRPAGKFDSGELTVIRDPAVLTGAYVLCGAHRADGTIGVAHEAQITLWIDIEFGSADSIELQHEFVDKDNAPNKARWTDLASTAATNVLTRTASGDDFADDMIGKKIAIHAGTSGVVPQVVEVLSVETATSLTLTSDPTNGSVDLVGGTGAILAGHTELAIDTSGGISTLEENVLSIPSSVGDGSYVVTIPTAGAPHMRFRIKCSGTVTNSGALVSFVPMPDGGV